MSTPERPTGLVVDGFDLNGIHDDGSVWEFQSIDGWFTGAGVNLARAQRIVDHGEFGQPGHRTGRLITIVGKVMATERGPVAAGIEQLAALLADGGFGTLEVTDRERGPLTAEVQLAADPDTSWMGGPYARYQLQLLAPDSYRYGGTATDSTGFAMDPVGSGLVFPLFALDGVLDFGPLGDPGVATVSNAGTAPASVVFRVAGPATGFTITDTTTGTRITYLGDLPAGSELVLDGRNGSVVIDGTADRSGDTIVDAWPTVPAGGTRDFLFEPVTGTPAAVLTAEVTSTFW